MSVIDRAEILTALGKTQANLADPDLALINEIHAPVESLIEDYLGFRITMGQYTEYLPPVRVLPEMDRFIDHYELINGLAVPWLRIGYLERRILQLLNLPVRSVESVSENLNAQTVPGGFWGPENLLVDGRDYYLDRARPEYSETGRLVRRSGAWPATERTVQIIYTAGYTQAELSVTIPKLRLAVIQAVIQNFHTLKMHQPDQISRGGGIGVVQAESLGDWSQTYGPSNNRNFGMMVALPDSVKQMLAKEVNYAQYL